ncbi:hypothetical protein [Chitinophaga deserti]|uniref:hypothetical protein n=1 Tax=Chitinophaga deserti TaxID=2164099 RepID=UPI0018E4ED00|nr:hypothetical protein [Chitinophaga deserti]
MKQRLQQISVFLLLGVFSIYLAPREYLHHFTGHEDTIDEPVCADDYAHGPAISSVHQHCDWLHTAMELYLPEHSVRLAAVPFIFAELPPVQPVPVPASPVPYCSLRAPPVA